MRLATSGAKALRSRKHLFAALRRCATQKLGDAAQGLDAIVLPHLSQRTRKTGHLAFAVIFCCFVSLQAQNPAGGEKPDALGPKADVIFVHANVYTGVPANAQFSSIRREEAIAVRGDRVQAVGKNVDMQKLKGPQTQIIDLGGHFAMPGFNDAHLHLADAGQQKLEVNLEGVKSLDELRQRVEAKVETAKGADWIVGGGWDETLWPVKALPTRWDLDEISGGHPVFVYRVDGHLAVANTRALQLASITIASRDPQGGHIDRDENGQPTGLLRDTAQQAVRGAI